MTKLGRRLIKSAKEAREMNHQEWKAQMAAREANYNKNVIDGLNDEIQFFRQCLLQAQQKIEALRGPLAELVMAYQDADSPAIQDTLRRARTALLSSSGGR
jgi:hypothetical protein